MAGKKYTDQRNEEFFRLRDRGHGPRRSAGGRRSWGCRPQLVVEERADHGAGGAAHLPCGAESEFLRLVREREIISTVDHDLGIHRPAAYTWARKAGISTSEAHTVNPRREESCVYELRDSHA